MDDQLFRIVIVGGGIAGLATAVALRKRGRIIVVLEKSSMLREVGALLSLQPNASKIVSSWNIDRFLATTEPVVDTAFRVLNTSGDLVVDIPFNSSYGADRVIYHRQDLHKALKDAALSGDLDGQPVTIRTAAPVVRCDPTDGIVILRDGEIIEADLVIGADGICSVLRENVLKTHVQATPTGLSAYRLLIEADKLNEVPFPKEIFDPEKPVTTLIVGHDRRVIMGPGRGKKLLGLVALLPEEDLNETSHADSWTSPGSMEKLLESFVDFPSWLHQIFKAAPELALWQMRDIPKLENWIQGQTILIGDAAHAMLPTQGQGASQSIEDAEALQAFFSDIEGRPTRALVRERLDKVFSARYQRASFIQAYSRQQARPGTAEGSNKVVLNPHEFADYNCNYAGAKDWLEREDSQRALEVGTEVDNRIEGLSATLRQLSVK